MTNIRGFTDYNNPDNIDFDTWRDEDIAIFDKLSDFANLKTDHDYTFTEEVIGQTSTGQDLYKFTTTILNPDGSTLATRVTTEAEGAGPGLYVFDTVTTIDGVAYHERYTENATGGHNREVI